jgi:hypothetical protein
VIESLYEGIESLSMEKDDSVPKGRNSLPRGRALSPARSNTRSFEVCTLSRESGDPVARGLDVLPREW